MEVDSLNIQITADVANAAQSIGSVENELNKLGESADSAGSDVSKLVSEMSAAASNMTSVSTNIDASSSGLAGFQSNIDAVASTLQGLNFKFDFLKSSVESSYSAFDGASVSVSNLSSASEASAAALNNIASATDGFGSRMGELQTSTSGTAEGMAALQRELTDALSQMRSFSDNMGTAGKDAEDAAKKIKELSTQVKNIPNKQVTDLAAGFRSLKGIVATLGIGKFIKDSNDAYKVQMQNELKLAAHMKHRMNATDDEIRSIKELASAQQQIGVIGDEIQLAGAQQLTTYARQASTLRTLIPAMNNLIAQNAGYEASTGDATSAADMLGRALNGQYTSLKRMGVTFTEAQENVLKYGNESQRAAVLADAINSKVGNMNELLANTPTGKFKQLKNELGDLQEETGATFQPLISSVVPVFRQVMTDLREPILAISGGISTIASAFTQLDSPFLKFILYGAVAASIINKLKLAMGGTAAGLLLLGTALAFIVGRTQEEQETVGDIVTNAMNAATSATDSASEAASNYSDELGEVGKAVSRLAGFDTITKLSGGSQGSLAASLYNENDINIGNDIADGLNDAKDAANELQDAFNSLKMPEIDFSSIVQGAMKTGSDLWKVIFGSEDEQYDALKRLNSGIEKIFGPEWTQFWQDVGSDIYNIFGGDDSQAYKGWYDLNEKVKGLFGEDFSAFWQDVGSDIYSIVNGDESQIYKGWLGLRDRVKDLFGKEFTDHFEGLGSYIYTLLHPDTAQNVSEWKDSYVGTMSGMADIVGMFNPYSADLMRLSAEAMDSINPINPYEIFLTGNYAAQDRYDVPMSLGTNWRNGGVPTDSITVNFNVDGEQVASAVVNQQDMQSETTNFRNR